jgi:hypothetical protein
LARLEVNYRFARRGWREKIGGQAKLEGKDRLLGKAKGKRQIVRRGWRENIRCCARVEGKDRLLGEARGKR